MTERERETIKLQANYANGLALVAAGAGGFAPMIALGSKLHPVWLIAGLSIFVAGMWLSSSLHKHAMQILQKLPN
ncbi:hypothetical protein NGM99_12560 [Mesorhizobium sp. RP14(2022)]|uniref:Amino acid transporter n=1 Tax=Mesorhizobium liriopis TaxID=2953882 RepID=A0ABT1C8V2_9HYPH|nr:hypothetical protein [Mesorhizobium liriopis]MCO6050615.1 hypothetical protein [Mesorhizobium liriopis]